MTKYKVGDKVLVRDDLDCDKDYYMEDGETVDSVVSEMFAYKGKVLEILDISYSKYHFKETGMYSWTDEMFAGKIVEKDTYEVGDTVLLRDDLVVDAYYGGLYFNPKMEKYNGKLYEIDKFTFSGKHYYLNGISEGWTFSNGMIVGALEKGTPVIEEEICVKPYAEPYFMKYKVGDTVVVKRDLKFGISGKHLSRADGSVYVTSEMKKLAGKKAKISKVDEEYGIYEIDIDGHDFNWTTSMFEEPVETEVVVINEMLKTSLFVERVIFSDPATVIFYKADGKSRKMVSKCCPDDTFDKEIGLQVALLKAMKKEADRELAKI